MEPILDQGIDIKDNRINKIRAVGVKDREHGRELLRKGIWLYFILLVFEGALRKWVLPGLASPLLIVRDPVAIWLLITAWRYDEFPANNYIWVMSFITVIAVFTAIMFGHGNPIVAVYGARILLFHFPLIFLIGRIFNRDDVIQLGVVLLWMAIPMFLLITMQFYSPQSVWVNRGIGGDITGSGFSGALGYYRPSGTFSFTTGNSQFFGLIGVFVIYFWLNPTFVNRTLLIAATVSLTAAIPLSISRFLFYQIGTSLVFATISIIRQPKYLSRMLYAGIGLIIIIAILSRASFFSNAIDALLSRFDVAKENEGDSGGSFSSRFLAGFFEALQIPNFPFFGLGIGMGTNAGAQILVGRSDEFLIAEGEWGRLIGEMGAVLGIAVILMRLNICITLIVESYKKLAKNDLLPWILLSVSLLPIAQGQWAQPTALGFTVIFGGLSVASLK